VTNNQPGNPVSDQFLIMIAMAAWSSGPATKSVTQCLVVFRGMNAVLAG
jgi:hypothetical protein